jgi:hypothetical protein
MSVKINLSFLANVNFTDKNTPKIFSWCSLVSIVSDYRQDDRGSIPGRRKNSPFSLCVQTISEVHTASYPKGIVVFSRGVKLDPKVKLAAYSRGQELDEDITPLPLRVCIPVAGQLSFFFLLTSIILAIIVVV